MVAVADCLDLVELREIGAAHATGDVLVVTDERTLPQRLDVFVHQLSLSRSRRSNGTRGADIGVERAQIPRELSPSRLSSA